MVDRTKPVAVCAALTTAPATTAEDWSRTVPARLDDATWESAAAAARNVRSASFISSIKERQPGPASRRSSGRPALRAASAPFSHTWCEPRRHTTAYREAAARWLQPLPPAARWLRRLRGGPEGPPNPPGNAMRCEFAERRREEPRWKSSRWGALGGCTPEVPERGAAHRRESGWSGSVPARRGLLFASAATCHRR